MRSDKDLTTPVALTAQAATTSPSSTHSIADRARFAAMRESTPDSDALASDEDENHDQKQYSALPAIQNQQNPRAQRRTSWLSEIQSGFPRRPSLVTSTSHTSQSVVQLPDPTPWPMGAALGRVSSNPTPSAWSSGGLWAANDLRKDSTARHLDIASPIQAAANTFSASLPSDDRLHSAIGSTKVAANSAIPFSIPLHPTPKSYRSQSYSVGQAEADAAQAAAQPRAVAASTGSQQSRQRTAPQQSLWNRPTRPSMLSEVRPNSNMSALREESDDMLDDHINNLNALHLASEPDVDYSTQHLGGPSSNPYAAHSASNDNLHSTDNARYEALDRFNGSPHTGAYWYSASHAGQSADDAKRSHWQTSLGFGELSEAAQGRRHSLAQVPTRSVSLTSASSRARATNVHSPAHNDRISQDSVYHRGQRQADPMYRNEQHAYNQAIQDAYGPSQYPVQRRPAQRVFPRPGPDTRLYLVSFKHSRADVFYVIDDTAPNYVEGDHVMVEADRGHDLGMIEYAGLSWAEARDLKAKADDDHFHQLMVFSRLGDPSAQSSANPASQHGPSARSSTLDVGHVAELKPKLIKRLAQPHEIATRRAKESNEDKAKRLCQQKVVEHGIDMEILDAEFQM